jgi:hypothetical protein
MSGAVEVHHQYEDGDESVDDLLSEVARAVRSGQCPYCNSALVASFDSHGEGLECPKCFWACGFSADFML